MLDLPLAVFVGQNKEDVVSASCSRGAQREVKMRIWSRVPARVVVVCEMSPVVRIKEVLNQVQCVKREIPANCGLGYKQLLELTQRAIKGRSIRQNRSHCE